MHACADALVSTSEQLEMLRMFLVTRCDINLLCLLTSDKLLYCSTNQDTH